MGDQESIHELINRARNGDRAAFDDLIGRYRSRIESLVHSRLSRHLQQVIEADDILQETFLKAFRSLKQFQDQGEDSFMRWMGTIAENTIRSAARRKGLLQTGELFQDVPNVHNVPNVPDRDVTPSRHARREERFDRLQDALDSLDPDSKKVIVLARIQGLPIKEVARRLERTPNATSILLYRALVKLKASFGDTESLGLPFRSLEERGESDGGELEPS